MRLLLLTLIGVLVWTGPGIAQEPGPGDRMPRLRMREAGPEPAARELLEQVMLARLSQDLGLNDEQTVILVRRISKFRDQMQELRQHRNEQMRELKNLVRDKAGDEAIEKCMGAIMAIEEKTFEMRREAVHVAERDLNPSQRAKLFLFLGEFEEDMRKLVQQARERRHIGPPVPPEMPMDQRPPRAFRNVPLGEPGRPDGPPRPPQAPRPVPPKPMN